MKNTRAESTLQNIGGTRRCSKSTIHVYWKYRDRKDFHLVLELVDNSVDEALEGCVKIIIAS